MKRNEIFTVLSVDIDVNGNLRPSSALHFMEECAAMQLEETGLGAKALTELGKAFYITRFSMGIYAPVPAFAKVRVEAFPTESKGFSFCRCARIYYNDMIIAEMSSIMALVDIQTKKLCAVTDVELSCETEEEISLDVPSRINIPKEQHLSLVGEKSVRFSDIDKNGHLNNTKYPDVFSDFIPDFRNKTAVSISVNFIKELPLGETVKVYCGSPEEDIYFLRFVKKNGDIATEARVVTEPVSQL